MIYLHNKLKKKFKVKKFKNYDSKERVDENTKKE